MKFNLKTAIIFSILIFFIFIPFASAAETKGIQISPLTFNFEIKPGDSVRAKIIVTNRNDEPLNYVIETENFYKVSDEGVPVFTAVPKQKGISTLADWYYFEGGKEGTIAPQQEKEIFFTVNIPKNAEPGGHYAAAFAKQVKKTAAGTTELGVAARVGVLTLVAVPGAVTKSAEISAFTHKKWVWQGPINIQMRVSNTGTVHYDSPARVELKSIFGAITPIDLGKHTIIPNNARIYKGKFNKKFPFGYYKVTGIAIDGNGNPVTTNSVIWAIPLAIVIPILAGLIILILFIRYLKHHLRFVPDKPTQ